MDLESYVDGVNWKNGDSEKKPALPAFQEEKRVLIAGLISRVKSSGVVEKRGEKNRVD